MFADCSGSIVPNLPGRAAGVVALDAGGAGAFFLLAADGPNRLLQWNGEALCDAAGPPLAEPMRRTLAAAAADIDADGREELLVRHADADSLFRRTPAGWRLCPALPPRGRATHAAAAALDRRGTGRYAFVLAGDDGPIRLYETGPCGAVVDLALVVGLGGVSARTLLVAPLISARADLYCGHDGGANRLFGNSGTGTFAAIRTPASDDRERPRAAAALDLLGNGRFGICVGNASGLHRLFAGLPEDRDRASPAFAMPSPVRSIVVADFDNDGYEEIFFHNHGEPNRLFRATPDGVTLIDAGAATDADGEGTGAAVADIDDDGRLELLLARGEATPQPLRLFKWPRNGYAWVRVKPRTRFGAAARGAVVRLLAGGRMQSRVIGGASEPVAHFGLGRDPIIDAIRIQWPDGATTELKNPPPLRTLDVAYPGG